MLEFVDGGFQVWAITAAGGDAVTPYPRGADLERPVRRGGMPRALRVVAPGGPMHVVARDNTQECSFTTAEDFDLLLAHLRELVRTHEVTAYASTLMSTHGHPALAGPQAGGARTPAPVGNDRNSAGVPHGLRTAGALLGAALPDGSGRGGPLRRGRGP